MHVVHESSHMAVVVHGVSHEPSHDSFHFHASHCDHDTHHIIVSNDAVPVAVHDVLLTVQAVHVHTLQAIHTICSIQYAVYDDELSLTGLHIASHKPDCHYCTCITIMMFLVISMALLMLQVIHLIHKYIYYDEHLEYCIFITKRCILY